MKKEIISVLTIISAFFFVPTAYAARTDGVWQTGITNSYITTTNPTGYDLLINGSNHYINFGAVTGFLGYGFRDNGGVMEFKNSGGSWSTFGSGSGSGTVTNVSVVTANGFAGTVANATTTPAITLSTTITGILKGNGTAISAATAGTDYIDPASLTLANVSANSTDATKSTYQMTALVPPRFLTAGGRTALLLENLDPSKSLTNNPRVFINSAVENTFGRAKLNIYVSATSDGSYNYGVSPAINIVSVGSSTYPGIVFANNGSTSNYGNLVWQDGNYPGTTGSSIGNQAIMYAYSLLGTTTSKAVWGLQVSNNVAGAPSTLFYAEGNSLTIGSASSPVSKLDVEGGNIYVNNTPTSGQVKAAYIMNTVGNNYHGLYDAGLTGSNGGLIIGGTSTQTGNATVTTAFFNTNTGNVGIGTTTTTAAKLTVLSASTNAAFMTATSSVLTLNDTVDSTHIVFNTGAGNGTTRGFLGADSTFSNIIWDSSDSTRQFTVQNSTGNVGIGTNSSSALAKLQVKNGNIYVDNVSSGNSAFTMNTSGTNYAGIFDSGGTGSNSGMIIGATTSPTGTNTVNGIYINNTTGKVGVGGLNTPTYPLDVNGTIGMSTGASLYMRSAASNSDLTLYAASATANIAAGAFYPGNGTNVASTFAVIPRGTGFGSARGQFAMFNTDFVADSTNWENIIIRSSGSAYNIFEATGGTGVTRPLVITASTSSGSNQLYIDNATTNVGINKSSPTAQLNIAAGSATASTAPLKLTSGTKLTTAEAGAMEFDGDFILTPTSGARYRPAGTLCVSTTTVGNVGTGEDDLQTCPLSASTLDTTGDFVEGSMQAILAGAIGTTKVIKIYFGATKIMDTTGFLAAGATGALEFKFKIVRTGATSQKISVTAISDNNLVYTNNTYTVGAETLSGALTLKMTGETSGVGTANNDVTETYSTVDFHPGN